MTTSAPPALDVKVPGLDQLFIAGHWVDPATDRTFDVISPSTEESVAIVADPSPADCDRAVEAGRAAYDSGPWPRMTVQERIEVCSRLCDAMEARLDDMNRAWAFESGAPLAHGAMINSGAGTMAWRRALEAAGELTFEEKRSGPMGDVLISHVPHGTVLAILTYNGPVVLMGMKVIPALLSGCPVVIKPAPESQLTTRIISECLEEADFPPGVVSVLAGGVEASQHLVSHDGIDLVAITGGTAIATDVLHRIADRIGRAILELGGKSAAIINEDVDLDAVLPTLVPGSSGFCGQVCVSLTRILAPRSRYDEIVDALASSYQQIKMGDPFDPETVLGPLAVKRALERAETAVEGALADGAKIATGGRRPPEMERGWYYEPTLLRDVDNKMSVAQNEVFGPVVCAIPYDGIDDAVAIANDSRYGLAASVYSADADYALDVARRLESGTVAINQAGVCLTEPWGGVKQSGYGRECGPEGILEFTDIRQYVLSGSYLES
jgi:acyl-CoA reductase-like NAD-dependent aldehyde dehydrogenase